MHIRIIYTIYLQETGHFSYASINVCMHCQAVYYRDKGADKLFIFGGEYATLDQFHHYNDLWELDLKTYIWAEVKKT